MKYLFKALVFTMIVPVFISTCTKEEDEYRYMYEGDIYFGFRHDSLDDFAGFQLYLCTKELFNCFNYSIATDEEYSHDRIDIHILDVNLDGKCATAIGPARAIIPMSFDSESYELVFHNIHGSDSHRITILDDSIHVSEGDTNFTWYNQEKAIYP